MTTPATIQEGATGATVRWLQYLLVRRTLSFTDIDGVFGPKTKHGVEEFQQSEHLTVDGIVGPATWGALGGDGPEPPTLSEGSRGGVVDRLQTVLNEGRGELRAQFQPGPRRRRHLRPAYRHGGQGRPARGRHQRRRDRGAPDMGASGARRRAGARGRLRRPGPRRRVDGGGEAVAG